MFRSHSVPAELVITTTFGTSHGPTQPLIVSDLAAEVYAGYRGLQIVRIIQMICLNRTSVQGRQAVGKNTLHFPNCPLIIGDIGPLFAFDL